MIVDKTIDVEQAFDSFVKSIGGTVLKETLKGDPQFENADYVFHEYGFVAELKCLQDNKLDDAAYMSKIDAAWQRWRHAGQVVGDTPEEIVLQNLPLECQRELVDIGETPLKGIVKKANKQIKVTKQTLNLSTYKGVLLVANDGNFGLPANTLWTLIGGLLSRGYTSIDNTVLFSVNMAARVPGADIPCMVWMLGYRSKAESLSEAVLNTIRDGWSKYHETLTDQNYRKFSGNM